MFGDSPCERGAFSAETASLSTGTLLGLPHPFYGGMSILSTKKTDYSSESNSYNMIHEINNLYPLDSYKTKKNILKSVSSDINKIVTSRPRSRISANRHVFLSGSRFPITPFKNSQDIRRYQNRMKKTDI